MSEIEKLVDFIQQRKLILEHKLQILLVEDKSNPRNATSKQNTEEMSSVPNSPNNEKIEPFSFKNEDEREEEQI
jgi:hypothetical protein